MVDKYNKQDIEEINNLGIELNPRFKQLFNLNDLNKLEEIYTYKKDNIILGFIHILNNVDKVEILNIIINKNYRQIGIASLLLYYILSITNKPIILEVKESNIEAINLYKNFNFIEIHRRKNYYKNEDAIIMERRNK